MWWKNTWISRGSLRNSRGAYQLTINTLTWHSQQEKDNWKAGGPNESSKSDIAAQYKLVGYESVTVTN